MSPPLFKLYFGGVAAFTKAHFPIERFESMVVEDRWNNQLHHPASIPSGHLTAFMTGFSFSANYTAQYRTDSDHGLQILYSIFYINGIV